MAIQVPVGPVNYSLAIQPGWCELDGEKCFGLCDRDNLEILISGAAPPAKRLTTAWHEIVHAWMAELAPGSYAQALEEEGVCDIVGLAMAHMDARLIARLHLYMTRGIEATDVLMIRGCREVVPVISTTIE
ncbi:MAG: hypothetical protein IT445_00065 [Phycisphaeraceae bacterium]|nr:hypothetical protein [Phycisphaeraceae bacterium]